MWKQKGDIFFYECDLFISNRGQRNEIKIKQECTIAYLTQIVKQFRIFEILLF